MNKFSFILKKKAIKCTQLLVVVLCSMHSFASPLTKRQQTQQQITGIVSDANGPLPAVAITIKGKALGTLTDQNGYFTIAATTGDVLVFSFLGYKTVETAISNQTHLQILLAEDATSLKEVTINAGYYTVKEKERTGSIAKITAKDIETQPVSNVLAAMQGRMAGVNITQNSGLPGGGFGIQVRGRNSIRNEGNDPLYVVNGVPYSSQSLSDATVSAAAISGLNNPLNILNPADIESIEVLKDADATAIYGSRGANGVVLITTKKGKFDRTRLNLNFFSTIGKVARNLDMMNTQQYLAMRTEAFENDGVATYPASAYDINGTWDQTRDTDWRKELIGGRAYITNAQASVSGGGNNTQFLLSGTYRKETTVFPGNNDYGKGAVHSSITHKSTDNRFSLNVTADYIEDKNTLPGRDLTSRAYSLAPNAPALFDEEGNLNWENGTFVNPLAPLEGKYLMTNQNLIANALLTYKMATGLEAKASLGFNDTRTSQSVTTPLSSYSPFDTSTHEALLMVSNGNGKSYIFEPQLQYQKKWGALKTDVLVGTTFQSQKTTKLAQSGSGFPSDALINSLAAASTIKVISHETNEYKYNAVFARVNLNWDEKYILNITGRRDGSSRFGPANRFANFGAVGAAWIFSNEKYFNQQDKLLSFGKLRASYGTSGNDQIGDYQYLDTYQLSPYLYNGVVGLTPSRLYNPDFSWESNKKLELAIETGFLKDKIFLSAAWFQNRSSNQLIGVPLPGTTGFPTIQSNFNATVENTGFEFELRTWNIKLKDFSWTTNFNLTVPKNKLIAFPNLETSTYANLLVLGESLFIRKVYDFTGIDPTTGTYTFRDFDGDGQITPDKDRRAIADTSPKYFGGISNQFVYKNWALDCLLQFVSQQGRNYQSTTPIAGTLANQPSEMANHFPQNGNSAVAQLYSTGLNSNVVIAYYNLLDSNAAYGDASYIRMKNISLSYTLPSTWSKIFNGKVYIQGQNLFTFTKFKGVDPENQSMSSLPPLKQFTFGVQLAF
ncbi:MAG: SusC/RagA family TonB-linked outer membrane protein [Bacteroidetes bacterium]|uniref:SusC/RagA family TonB-linked outer membrane protein n=1 Tax=Flavobacterium sp. TaxID=239 RepID=UPI002FDB07B1|nr:SusC/RagA family TonB-linked outer membrane protein [Bacteroidota bacterium]